MENKILLYTSSGCPHCHKVKEQLVEWGVSYEERNVSESREYFAELQERKIFGTPATFINNKPILGFQPARMLKALGWDEPPTPVAEAAQQDRPSEAKAERDAAAHPDQDSIFGQVTPAILDEVYDFVSIGGGPAGASAAMYAARGRLKTLVIDRAPAAGTLAITHKIANYPGIRQEMTGYDLLQEMQLHAKDFGATFVRTQVLEVDFSNPEEKLLHVPEGTIRAKSVFIAVGAKAPSSKIDGEEEFTGRGVSYCSTCDAAFFEGRTVVVVGDNEEAVHEAESLAKFSKEVRLLIPTGEVRGQVDLSSLEALDHVKIYRKHRLRAILGEDSVDRVRILDDERNEHTWEIDGVFLYLAGMKPGTDFLKDAIERDGEGYIVVDDMLKSSVDGVFAGGDARRTPIKQAVVSAADGCVAALAAEQFVNKRSKMRPQY